MKCLRYLFCLLAVATGLAGPVIASADELDDAFDVAITGDPAGATRLLERLLNGMGEANPEERDHLRYIIARMAQSQEDCDSAMTELLTLEGGEWAARAAFLNAECALASGHSAEALQLFATQAEAIFSDERIDELADQLMGYARTALTEDEYGYYLNSYEGSQILAVLMQLVPEDHPFYDEAEHYQAMVNSDTYTLERRIRENPTSQWACEERLQLASLQAHSPGLLYVMRNCEEAEAAEATETLANYEAGLSLLAIEEFANRFPTSEHLPTLLGRAAELSIGRVPDAESWELVSRALDATQGSRLELIARLRTAYGQTGQNDRIRQLWTMALESSTRPEVLSDITRQWVTLRNDEVSAAWAVGDVDTALSTLETLIEEVPEAHDDAQMRAARILAASGRYDEALAKLELVETYIARQYRVEILEAAGRYDEAAPLRREIFGENRAERLSVRVPRTFNTGETPHVVVNTDALSEVSVRIHIIDVEDHLRSMATMNNIQGMDVDLIEPDETLTFTLEAPQIDGFDQPGPVEQELSLPDLGAGVYAVEVVGQTQRASALVQVSDLGLIVRSSGGDILVLAVDTRRGTSVAGAEIVVTNGNRIVAEGTTGTDGVFRTHQDPSQIEVLGTFWDSASWTRLSGSGQDADDIRESFSEYAAQTLTIDRDDALAGESIRFAGFAISGAQTPDPFTGELQAELRYQGQLIDAFTVEALNGAFDGSLALPWDAVAGTYELKIGDARDTFTVAARLGERASLTRVVQRAPVEAGQTALYDVWQYNEAGLPDAGIPVVVDLRDGQDSHVYGLTDEDGHLVVEVPTYAGLQMPYVGIAGWNLTVEEVGGGHSLDVQLGHLAVGAEIPAHISWEGTEGATTVVTLFRDEWRSPSWESPEPRPDWAPNSNTAYLREIITQSVHTLDSTGFDINLPSLEEGEYSLRVESFTADGQCANYVRSFAVQAEGELSIASDAPFMQTRHAAIGEELEVELATRPDTPVLLTLEGTGIENYWVLERGTNRAQIALGSELQGHLSLAAIGMNTELVSLSDSETVSVESVIDVRAEVSDWETAPSVNVTVRTEGGEPVRAPVIVALVPARTTSTISDTTLFRSTLGLLPGSSGWSATLAATAQSSTIDQELLRLQEEQQYARREAERM
ncbi:MAG: hypothetical protein KC561_06885, partial [Myxococcales bacterium]|nr:hypothetical protein [Myxococcales bacterium]